MATFSCLTLFFLLLFLRHQLLVRLKDKPLVRHAGGNKNFFVLVFTLAVMMMRLSAGCCRPAPTLLRILRVLLPLLLQLLVVLLLLLLLLLLFPLLLLVLLFLLLLLVLLMVPLLFLLLILLMLSLVLLRLRRLLLVLPAVHGMNAAGRTRTGPARHYRWVLQLR